jgi:hypothetical protein
MLFIFSGDSINPFDDELITKLLRKVIKFPNERHLSGYREYKSDMPCMRSEFKLGIVFNLYTVISIVVRNIILLLI